jgi:4-hydroxy-tetrahydrodipicolinate synthase
MAELSGLILAMQTPFHDNGAVDWDRFVELIEIYVKAGIDGLLLSSGTGQHAYLTEQECNEMFRLGNSVVRSRIPVVCQSSALNMDEVVRRSIAAQEAGATAVMILPPFFEGPRTEEGVFLFYESVARRIDIDIVAYNIPSETGVEITQSIASRLKKLRNVPYIKDSSGDLAKQQALVATGMKILNGADPVTPHACMFGAVGAIWGGANYMPNEAVELFALLKMGNYHAAIELWRKLIPVVNVTWLAEYIPAVKAASNIAGYHGGSVRPPILPIKPDTELLLKQAIAHLRPIEV